MYLEISLIIFSAALLLLVLFCIPVLLKLWRIASDITVSLQVLNQRLPAILKNMEEISTNINNSTTAINGEIQKYAATARRFHTVMTDVVGIMELISPLALKSSLFRKMTGMISMVKGIRVFLNVLAGRQKV